MTRDQFLTRLADFHARLDIARDDWQTRLVIADLLEEYGDETEGPGAPGYRALAAVRFVPHFYPGDERKWGFTISQSSDHLEYTRERNSLVNRDPNAHDPMNWRDYVPHQWGVWSRCAALSAVSDMLCVSLDGRRAVEDALATAFSSPELTDEFRASVLALLDPVATVAATTTGPPKSAVRARRRSQ
jgi:hypothetical protein